VASPQYGLLVCHPPSHPPANPWGGAVGRTHIHSDACSWSGGVNTRPFGRPSGRLFRRDNCSKTLTNNYELVVMIAATTSRTTRFSWESKLPSKLIRLVPRASLEEHFCIAAGQQQILLWRLNQVYMAGASAYGPPYHNCNSHSTNRKQDKHGKDHRERNLRSCGILLHSQRLVNDSLLT